MPLPGAATNRSFRCLKVAELNRRGIHQSFNLLRSSFSLGHQNCSVNTSSSRSLFSTNRLLSSKQHCYYDSARRTNGFFFNRVNGFLSDTAGGGAAGGGGKHLPPFQQSSALLNGQGFFSTSAGDGTPSKQHQEQVHKVIKVSASEEQVDNLKLIPIIKQYIFSSAKPFSSVLPHTQNQIFPPTNGYLSNLSSSLQRHIYSDNPSHGQKIHSRIIKTGFIPNTNISIKPMILYLRSSCLKYARQMFDTMSTPTLSAYNYMINGYVKNGLISESFDLFQLMILAGERPDGFTFSMILKASTCNNGGKLLCENTSIGKEVYAQIVKSDVELDNILCTILVDSFAKQGRVHYARKIFDMMMDKNVVCSTSMISGYMNLGFVQLADEIFAKTAEKDIVVFNAMIEGYSKTIDTGKRSIEVYIDMQRLNFKPNISTFASIIGACSIMAAYEVGEQVQAQLLKTDIFTHIKIGSALLDMYSKCGRIESARKIFDGMPEKNVYSWTSMIDGYGKNGNPNTALELFNKMKTDHFLEPNHVTFLSALSACGHAGLVFKGMEIFESMKNDYFLKPKMEHYACMVDLLGRAGSLHQALKFVKDMPDRPNSDVWAALLSSCNLHGDVNMASIASNEIFKLKAKRPGAYVALSNTLAAAEKWNKVSELRDLMKVREISKDTGRSWSGTDNTSQCSLSAV